MTENSQQSQGTPAPRPSFFRGRRGTALMLAGVALTAGLAGAFASKALSHGRWGGPHGEMGYMGGHHGGPMGMMGMMGGADPAKAARKAGRMAERFARRIDATGDQQAKLVAIAEAAAKDVAALRQQVRDARVEGMKLLGAAQVDRTQIEKLRTEQVANMDAISKRMTTALADAAEVLTPEQRQKVAERMDERRQRGRWGFGHGGHDGEDRGPRHRGPGGPDGPGGPGAGEPAPKQ